LLQKQAGFPDDGTRMAKLMRYLNSRFIEYFELRTDAVRALRGMVAFAVPLGLCHWLDRPAEAIFISTAALNLSLPDLRGAYPVRVGILATMILLAAGSAFLGVSCAGNTAGAVLGMGAVALLGGAWRHLSADYGPGMAVSSALLFLLGLSQPGDWSAALHQAELTGLGGAFAAALHGCVWLFRPQHALRYAVAETWVAASDLVAAMRPGTAPEDQSRSEAIARLERELRAALDRTFVILGGAESRKPAKLIAVLEEMRVEVVHLTMRVIAFNTALEPLVGRPEFAGCLPVMDSVLKAMSDAARSVAVTLIMHRPENLAASNVRLRRCQHLLRAFDEQISAVADDAATAQARATLAQVGRVLSRLSKVLVKTADHSPSRLTLAASLPDIGDYSIRAVSSWIRPASQADPVLIRHSARMAVFTMLAVAIYMGFSIPRGYWIALTIMVVLQPDYGSTRQRAVARVGGTLGGSMLAGALLWLQLPLFMLDLLAAVAAFIFAYFLKRRYWLAIFFVTVNLVLITETLAAVHGDFMAARVLATLLGGGLALVAARLFWPIWEGEKFPSLLAMAIRANRAFLLSLFAGRAASATAVDNPLMARRKAENANRHVAASVERLLGEPAGVQEDPERAASLATYCQRITRALTVLAVQLPFAGKLEPSAIFTVSQPLGELLERLARVVESGCQESEVAGLAAELGELETDFTQANHSMDHGVGWMTSPAGLLQVQMVKILTEVRAMTLALKLQTPVKNHTD
jgi:uncharacterized membrane protein YccC